MKRQFNKIDILDINGYDYDLPADRIAAHPCEPRDACKLLVAEADGEILERRFTDLPSLLPEDALLICNNTRVINARLRFRKASGAAIEIFCLEPHSPADYAENFAATGHCQWLCLVGNSKRWKQGALEMPLLIDGSEVTLRAERRGSEGNAFVIEFSWEGGATFATMIEAAGQIPIPPYLNRDTEATDTEDYQTVYSLISGSVAAPTAGLHFTQRVLSDLERGGIPRRELTLHVGAGTFQPVKDDDVRQHVMHSEFIAVPLSLIRELRDTSRQVYAVGTTSVRTLESLYHIGCLMSQERWTGEVPQWYPYEPEHPGLSVAEALDFVIKHMESKGLPTLIADTRIIIAPGYRYRIVRGIITNFHQPRSTLLLLVSAFIGDGWRKAYDYALAHDFRFLSYGDACLLKA